jgi:hypothetical protein
MVINKFHVLKKNSISIEAQVKIPRVRTCEKGNLKIEGKKNYSKHLWKYGSILAIQKNLVGIDYDFWGNNFT